MFQSSYFGGEVGSKQNLKEREKKMKYPTHGMLTILILDTSFLSLPFFFFLFFLNLRSHVHSEKMDFDIGVGVCTFSPC